MLEQFQSIGEELCRCGLVGSHGGNMSIRVADRIFITKRYILLGKLKESDIIDVPVEGEINSEASRELAVHRAIYGATAAKAIIHAHGPYSVSLSITENKIMLQDSEGQFFFNQGVPIIKVRSAIGSDDVTKMLPGILNNGYSIAMIKGHGSFAIADTLEKCLHYTSMLETSCKIIAVSRLLTPKAPVREQHHQHKSAIPPGLGVMDRTAFRRSRAFKPSNLK